MISQQDRAHWAKQGWVAFGSILSDQVRDRLPAWVDDVARDRQGEDLRLHYHEAVADGPKLCRTERFLEDHEGLRELITGPELTGLAAALLGEASVLYKEKINYKHPGGAGYAPHQDATAYAFVKHHVTCLIAVDAMTPENGCLEFASGPFDRLLEIDESGCIAAPLAEELDWAPVSLPVGGVLFFNSLAPHRSGPNHSGASRRALYLTYNARAEGDLRAAYYAERDRAMAATRGNAPTSVRISTIGHFQGTAAG